MWGLMTDGDKLGFLSFSLGKHCRLLSLMQSANEKSFVKGISRWRLVQC